MGLVRIDDNPENIYKWFGNPAQPSDVKRAVLVNVEMTPTRTIFNITAGPIDLYVTWLSPIEACHLD